MVDYYSSSVGRKWWIFPLVGGLVFIVILYLGVFRSARKKRQLAALRQHQLEQGLPTLPNPYAPNPSSSIGYTYIEADTNGYNRTTVFHSQHIPMTQQTGRDDDVPPAYHVAVSPPPKVYDGGGLSDPVGGNFGSPASPDPVDVTSGTHGTHIFSNSIPPSASLGRSDDETGFWGRFKSRQRQVAEGRRREMGEMQVEIQVETPEETLEELSTGVQEIMEEDIMMEVDTLEDTLEGTLEEETEEQEVEAEMVVVVEEETKTCVYLIILIP